MRNDNKLRGMNKYPTLYSMRNDSKPRDLELILNVLKIPRDSVQFPAYLFHETEEEDRNPA
jgi:hypothetical protein